MDDINKLINKLNESKKELRPPDEGQAKTTYRKIPVVEIKDPGVYRFRLLPNKKDPLDLPFEPVSIHIGFVHPNFGKRAPLVCQGKGCPLCLVYERKNAKQDSEAWKYQGKQRFIYYALNDREEIVLLSLNYYAQEKLLEKILANAKAGINIMDMMEGYWFDITLNIVDKRYKYNVAIDTVASHRVKRETREEFDKLKHLNKFYLNHSVEDLKKILKGEKVVINYNGSKPAQKENKPVIKPEVGAEVTRPPVKFASDEVEKVGNDEDQKPSANEADNMRRLQDIMGKLDFEE